MAVVALIVLAIVPGLIGVIVFAYYATVDWAALQVAYRHYAQVAAAPSDLRLLFVAESDQNIHRINLFADGVWTILSAILCAIGLHGICAREASRR